MLITVRAEGVEQVLLLKFVTSAIKPGLFDLTC